MLPQKNNEENGRKKKRRTESAADVGAAAAGASQLFVGWLYAGVMGVCSAGVGAEALNVLVGCIAAGRDAEGGGALGDAPPPLENDALGEGAAPLPLENGTFVVGGGAAEDPTIELPSAKLTSLSGAVFPLKNSDADRDGSMDGAGG